MNKLRSDLMAVKSVSRHISRAGHAKRKAVIVDFARNLLRFENQILAANRRDLAALGDHPLSDRLMLDHERLVGIAASLRQIAGAPDPLNQTLQTINRPNGLVIKKVSVPLGIVAVIYESRPNVTADLAALALKSGNAVILKGGKESFRSNQVLTKIFQRSLRGNDLPEKAIYLVDPASNWQEALLAAYGLIDVIIPRGGSGLINYVRKHSQIPVIETGAGVCHAFVDSDCNFAEAVRIIVNAKTQRPTVCNSLDTLVIHQKAAPKLLRALSATLAAAGVMVFADRKAYSILQHSYPSELLFHAAKDDYGREFLSLKMAIKTVADFPEGGRIEICDGTYLRTLGSDYYQQKKSR